MSHIVFFLTTQKLDVFYGRSLRRKWEIDLVLSLQDIGPEGIRTQDINQLQIGTLGSIGLLSL